MRNLILVGGGGHCAAAIDVIEQQGGWRIEGVVDADPSLGSVLGHPVLGNDDDLPRLAHAALHALVTIGQIRSPAPRMRLYHRLQGLGFQLPTIASPRAYVSRHAVLGPGTIVMHDALVNARARVGCNCIVNSKALVEHDARVGDHCHISTQATLNGGAVVHDEGFVGSGAVCIEGAVLPKGGFVKANALYRG